jgi:HlyD family type I secretion membrane fusion protein
MLSNSNSKFLPSVEINEFLPPIHRWITFGGLAIVFTVALAVPIASVAKYKETVKAQAIVRPAGELRIVQAAAAGSVKQIFVKDNQVVKQGDIIATIDNSQLQTKHSQLQTNIQQAQLQLVQINAQIGALDRQVLAEIDRTNRAIAAAEAELSGRRRDFRDQQITTAAEVEEAEANLKSVEAALEAARSKWHRYQPLAETGAISKDQFEETQLEVEQQEQAVAAARATWQRTQAALNPSDSEVVIASERIAQEQATGSANVATLSKERETLLQQRITAQKQLERDTHELQQVEFDLTQTAITATADGIISKINLRNSGQIVRAGEEIAQIVPSHAPLTIKAVVPSQEKSKLQQGQKVQMRVSACPYPDYGTLQGQVKTISPDAFGGSMTQSSAHDANTTGSTTASSSQNSSGSAFYEVMIEPESLSFGQSGNRQCVIEVGMEGRVDIISREETVLQFLLRKARLITDL